MIDIGNQLGHPTIG